MITDSVHLEGVDYEPRDSESTPHNDIKDRGGEKSTGPSVSGGWTAIVTWLLLNAIWTGAVMTRSTVEVSSHDGTLTLSDTIAVPDHFGLGRETRVLLSCDFDAKPGANASEVLFEHTDPDGNTETLWSGGTGGECPMMDVLWKGGTHTLDVTISRNGSEVVPAVGAATGEVSVDLWVLDSIRNEGYIAFNILGLILFVTDRAIRHWMAKRRAARIRHMPLHERRRREEWAAIDRSLEGGDGMDVDDLLTPETSGGDSEFDRRMRSRPWVDESVEEIGDRQLIEAADVTPLDEYDTEGDESTMRGDLQIDRDIRTVGDIWRRMFGRK